MYILDEEGQLLHEASSDFSMKTLIYSNIGTRKLAKVLAMFNKTPSATMYLVSPAYLLLALCYRMGDAQRIEQKWTQLLFFSCSIMAEIISPSILLLRTPEGRWIDKQK